MATYDSKDIIATGPSFTIEIKGTLVGVDFNIDILEPLVEAILALTLEPIKRVVIHFREFLADIEIHHSQVKSRVRIEKMKSIATKYDSAIKEARLNHEYDDDTKQLLIKTYKESMALELQAVKLTIQ